MTQAIFLGLLLSASLYAAPQSTGEAGGERPRTLKDQIITNSARPLEEVLTYVEQTLAAPFVFQEIAIPDGNLVSGDKVGLDPKARVMPHYDLNVSFVPGETDALTASRVVLTAYEREHLPGKYEAEQSGTLINVHPASNALTTTPITLPPAERTPDETIRLIADQVSKALKMPVVVGWQPYTGQNTIVVEAHQTPLINVLERLNEVLGPTSYKFLYDPSEHAYYMSLYIVRASLSPNVSKENKEQSFAPSTSKLPVNSPYFTKDKP